MQAIYLSIYLASEWCTCAPVCELANESVCVRCEWTFSVSLWRLAPDSELPPLSAVRRLPSQILEQFLPLCPARFTSITHSNKRQLDQHTDTVGTLNAVVILPRLYSVQHLMRRCKTAPSKRASDHQQEQWRRRR